MQANLTDDYFKYYHKYKSEYEFVCILYQIGSFYELKGIKNETESIGNIDVIAKLLNIQVTKSNKNISKVDRKNPLLAGFPIASLTKYLPVLIENGFVVVVIDQIENNASKKFDRKVSGVYSKSIQPLFIDTTQEQNFTSILLENDVCSVINVNMYTNVFEIYNIVDNILDTIVRILFRYTSNEIILTNMSQY